MAHDPLMMLPAKHQGSAGSGPQSIQAPQPPRSQIDLSPDDQIAMAGMFPRCVVCGRIVEKMAWSVHPETKAVTFAVACHGAKQAMTLPPGFYDAMVVTGGVAFAEDRKTVE